MYHGVDIRNGNSISFSHSRNKRFFYPNVQNKRLWSDALDDFVRFKVTTKALKAIDDYGGIDNYILQLDQRLVDDSNYVTKMRNIIGSTLFYKGTLHPDIAKRLGYLQNPPLTVEQLKEVEEAVRQSQRCISKKPQKKLIKSSSETTK